MKTGVGEEMRCPSCSRLLVLRTGPAVRPHFAHRPRQSCRKRPGTTAALRSLRLEQLTLFELDADRSGPGQVPELALEAIPAFYWEPEPDQPVLAPAEVAARRRRRRKAWLPRLVRWIRTKSTRTGVPRPSPLKLEETPARGSERQAGYAGQ